MAFSLVQSSETLIDLDIIVLVASSTFLAIAKKEFSDDKLSFTCV